MHAAWLLFAANVLPRIKIFTDQHAEFVRRQRQVRKYHRRFLVERRAAEAGIQLLKSNRLRQMLFVAADSL